MTYTLGALVALLTVTLPGLPAALALRLTGLRLVAGTVAASFAAIAIATLTGLQFSPLLVAAVACTLTLIAWALTAWLPEKTGRENFLQYLHQLKNTIVTRRALYILIALGVATTIITFELVTAFGSPENPSQTYDAIYHLNLSRHIMDTGQASPLTVSLIGNTPTTYPTLWHASVALVASLSGLTPVTANNIFAIVVAATVWPSAMFFFIQPFIKRHGAQKFFPRDLLLTAILIASMSTFPYLLLTWGALYPNFLSIAILPIALGFLQQALQTQNPTKPLHNKIASWTSLLAALGAAILAHPNAFYSFAIIATPLIARAVYTKKTRRHGATIGVAAFTLWIILLTLAWRIADLGDSNKNYPKNPLSAAITLIGNSPFTKQLALFLTLLTLLGGLILLLRKQNRTSLVSYTSVIFFGVIALGTTGALRDTLTGPWYNDAVRIAGLLPIVVTPLAVTGCSLILDTCIACCNKASPTSAAFTHGRKTKTLTIATLGLLLLVGVRGSSISAQTGWLAQLHEIHAPGNEETIFLDTDRIALINEIKKKIPENTLIAADPWSGGAYIYSMTGTKVLYPHVKGAYTEDALNLAQTLQKTGQNACQTLQKLGVEYVADLGETNNNFYDPKLKESFIGLHKLQNHPALKEEARHGEAVLYKVNCKTSH